MTALMTAVGVLCSIFLFAALIFSSVDGRIFHRRAHGSRKSRVAATLRTIHTADELRRGVTYGRWGWRVPYATFDDVAAYVRFGIWWRVPLWFSHNALTFLRLQAVTGGHK